MNELQTGSDVKMDSKTKQPSKKRGRKRIFNLQIRHKIEDLLEQQALKRELNEYENFELKQNALLL